MNSFEHADAGIEYARFHDWGAAAREFQKAIDAFPREEPPLSADGMPERFWPAIWHGRRTSVMLLKANGGVIDAALQAYADNAGPTRDDCEWNCGDCPFRDCIVYVMQGARMMIADLFSGRVPTEIAPHILQALQPQM